MYQTKPLMSTGSITIARRLRPNPAFCRRSWGFGRDCTDLRHVPHLAAGPGRPFAVKVDGRAGDRQPLLIIVDVFADQVGHGHRPWTHRLSERPAGNGA